MNKRFLALFLAFSAALIYGLSFTIAKDVMPRYIKPYAFILIRVLGASILFWLVSLRIPKERITPKDFVRIAFSALFGVAINMLAFFKGLSMTTPINGSVIMTTSPIMVLVFSFIFLHEKITIKKVVGILLAMTGAIMLVVFGPKKEYNAPDIPWGNLLVFLNATSYAMYLIIAKPLLQKYHPFHLVKWIYLFGLLMVLPFGFAEMQDIYWAEIPKIAFYKIGFVVLFTTFLTYLFNLIALRNLKPNTLGVFVYVQPLIASIYAIVVGSDSLSGLKLLAALLIFSGVYMVSYKKGT